MKFRSLLLLVLPIMLVSCGKNEDNKKPDIPAEPDLPVEPDKPVEPDTFERQFGDFGNFKETQGWNEDKTGIVSNMDENSYTFFKMKNPNEFKFDIEAKFLSLNKESKSETGFGVCLIDDDGNYVTIQAKINPINLSMKLVSTSYIYNEEKVYFEKMDFTFLEKQTFKFELIHDYSMLNFFFNRQLIDSPMFEDFEEKSLNIGIYTKNASIKFTNYNFISERTEIDERLDNFNKKATLYNIDANLDDWKEEDKTNKVRVFGEKTSTVDYSKQGFEVYAKYIKGDGLYIGGFGKHYYNITEINEWHKNTNFEFFINGKNQYFITAKTNSGNMANSAFKTELTGDIYTTTFEAYVAESTINFGVYDNHVRVGFAFKNCGELIKIPNRDAGGLTEYWWEDKHFPNLFPEQYYVTEKGILYNL